MDNFSQNFMDYNSPTQGNEFNDIYKDPMFNPIMQYEQAYYYYRYLTMQMEYKIKCKEYELLCLKNSTNRTPTQNNQSSNERGRRIE